MALASNYVQVYGKLPEVFARISEGQAPDKFTRQHLKDLGFASSNFHAVIPLLKTLGFLTADGAPTARYHAYRDHSQSRAVLGQALREAYGDLFTIKADPKPADKKLIEGKFKSTHNVGERPAELMASTFYALLAMADLSCEPPKVAQKEQEEEVQEVKVQTSKTETLPATQHRPSLHYNIQIHLPATKDVEVFNAIFKSLREHLLD
jgi:hypothetical protein